MAKELSVLQQQAEAIKTEVNKGANTSSRIGGMFGDMLEYNEEKLTELENNNISKCTYLKNKDLVGNTFNFSKFGYYRKEEGYVFKLGEQSWGVGWLVIFIPVKVGLTYNVSNFGGADGNREACMVDINLNYCHSITTSNNQITAQEDDAYLAVSYGSEVTTDTTYYIDYNPLLSNNKITKLVNDLELKTLLYKEKKFTKGEVDGNLLINDTAIQHVNIGDSTSVS